MTYSDKLKDPRWDEKRKEILLRDNFQCQLCRDKDTDLHVHHKYYSGAEPWDYPGSCLITLCKECHALEHLKLDRLEKHVFNCLRRQFMADEISKISVGFLGIKPDHVPTISADMIQWFLSDREALDIGFRMYFMFQEKSKT